MEKEIWKVYKDTRQYRKDGTIFQGSLWEVSNYGNIKRDGNLVLPRYKNKDSHPRFRRGECLHRVVAELFIPNPDNKPEIDHIDTNKLNNRFDNLRWVTHKENMNNPLTIKRIHTDLWKSNISDSLKKSNKLKGRHLSEETKQKISNTLKGHEVSEETKQKLRKPKIKGKSHGPKGKHRIYNNDGTYYYA